MGLFRDRRSDVRDRETCIGIARVIDHQPALSLKTAEPQVSVRNTTGAISVCTEACQALDKGASTGSENLDGHCFAEAAISAFTCCHMVHAELFADVRVPSLLPSQIWAGLYRQMCCCKSSS